MQELVGCSGERSVSCHKVNLQRIGGAIATIRVAFLLRCGLGEVHRLRRLHQHGNLGPQNAIQHRCRTPG